MIANTWWNLLNCLSYYYWVAIILFYALLNCHWWPYMLMWQIILDNKSWLTCGKMFEYVLLYNADMGTVSEWDLFHSLLMWCKNILFWYLVNLNGILLCKVDVVGYRVGWVYIRFIRLKRLNRFFSFAGDQVDLGIAGRCMLISPLNKGPSFIGFCYKL